MTKNQKILLSLGIMGLIIMGSITAWVIPVGGRKFAELFQRAEYQWGIPRFLLAKQAQQESAYDPMAVSSAGAQGIMQIVPKWHPGVNPFDPVDAINYAGKFMRQLYDRFGSWKMALAAYNAGPTALQKRIDAYGGNWLEYMPEETRKYVAKITRDIKVT